MKSVFSWCYAALAVLAAAAVLCAGAENISVEAAAVNGGTELPIIMYHSILDSEKKAGKYVITPEELEEDILYLHGRGYTTVLMGDVCDHVLRGKRLPEKAIALTFDDGCYNFYSYAYPLLQKYDARASVAVIGRYADMYSVTAEPKNNNYTCLAWSELMEMSASGRVEVMNHSYNMHGGGRQGLKQNKGESAGEYALSVKNDMEHMQRRMREELGKSADVFVYPYGYTSPAAEAAVRELGFAATLTCYERVNTLTPDAKCLYGLGRFNRPHGVGAEEFFRAILPAEEFTE